MHGIWSILIRVRPLHYAELTAKLLSCRFADFRLLGLLMNGGPRTVHYPKNRTTDKQGQKSGALENMSHVW